MEETNSAETQAAITQHYNYAADLLVNQKFSAAAAKEALVNRGLDSESAAVVVDNLSQQITDAKKERAKKDMLYGALWCVGGIVGTMANIGFIFWGAILFGGIQLIKGLINADG